MRKIKWLLLVCLVSSQFLTQAQSSRIDSVKFFTDEKLIDMTLTTDIRKLQSEKGLDVYQPATVSLHFPDSTATDETVSVAPRGHFRRDYCTIPPILINFRNPGAPVLSSLGTLKLVIGCGSNTDDEQLILKEYLAYKIYNLLEEKSFRVRLLRVSYRDSRNKMKPFSQYAFLIEDDKDMAERNGCIKKEKLVVLTERTNRDMMTMVAVFEYMISNGDWSVPNNHNIKLIFDKDNAAALPFAVPYDFDHSGLVDASYALPNEVLGTEKVTERVYRGFPRTMEELQTIFDVFRKQKDKIISLVTNFSLLTTKNRKVIVDYLEEFYKTINDRHSIQNIFIDNARTQ